MSRVVLVALLCLQIACSESFAPPSAVTDLRVVGARVELQSDSERANPSPDDDLRVSILVIDQGAPPSDVPGVPTLTPPLLQWRFVPCIPLPTTIGPPICLSPIEPCDGCVGTPPEDALATPVLRFAAPSQEDLDEAEATSVLVQGVVCGNGTPSEDAILRFLMGESEDLMPCEGTPIIAERPVEGRFVSVQIPIETDPSDPNLNPELLNVLLDGGSWPPPYDRGVRRTAPRTGCAADLEGLSEEEQMAHPRAGGQPSTIDLAVTQDSLQTFMVDDVEVTEQIQVSWLADGGGFQNAFSFIVAPASSVLTQWEPPSSAPDDGELVRFDFVIRDGRGGSDWVERGLCILPPAPP
jgi:hypothetical protein